MANTTLTVDVFGGQAPVTIRVRFFKNGDHLLDLSSPNSFTHTFFNLGTGEYDIYIMGFNPRGGGHTVCTLSEEEIILHPPDPSPTTAEGVAYLVSFHFSVQ